MSQPIKPALEAVLLSLDIIAQLAVSPDHGAEVRANVDTLNVIARRAELVYQIAKAGLS